MTTSLSPLPFAVEEGEDFGMAEKWDTLTLSQYWALRGEDPGEKRPTPWWMLAHERPPEPPRRLVKRSSAQSTETPPRRRLVRIGKASQD